MDKIRVHVFISGFVQGVNFRYYTKKFADSLRITGWVRNLEDGRVEIVAEGDEKDIEKFINFLKIGPSSAKVSNVEIKKEEYKGEFKNFEVYSTTF